MAAECSRSFEWAARALNKADFTPCWPLIYTLLTKFWTLSMTFQGTTVSLVNPMTKSNLLLCARTFQYSKVDL